MEQTSVTPMHRETAADKTRNLTKMALCVAFLAISSYLAFPLPFTPAMVVGTTIIVNMTAFILKPNDAFLVVLAWLLIGAIGVPVLPGGSAGLGRLLGPTGACRSFTWAAASPCIWWLTWMYGLHWWQRYFRSSSAMW